MEKETRTNQVCINDTYTLRMDSLCMWIEKNVKSKKTNKEYGQRVTGYHQSYERLFLDFAKRKIRDLDAAEVSKALEEMKEIEKEVLDTIRETAMKLNKNAV